MNSLKIGCTEWLSKRVWIWGCRNMGTIAAQMIMNSNGNIAGFIDNDCNVQNTIVMSIKVYSPVDFLVLI